MAINLGFFIKLCFDLTVSIANQKKTRKVEVIIPNNSLDWTERYPVVIISINEGKYWKIQLDDFIFDALLEEFPISA